MPLSQLIPQVPSPRVVVVLAGAAGQIGTSSTAFEQASMPQLSALAIAGRVGRLRTIADHLPVSETIAAAALLGSVPPKDLDPGAVAAATLGRLLAADELCTVVRVLDLTGDPAPALDVERAAEAMAGQLPWHRIVGVYRGHQVLVAGSARPALPMVEGLRLRVLESGFVPGRHLDASTVVIAAEGSTVLGVAALLGATVVGVDPNRADSRDPVPTRLREQATAALVGGAQSVVLESRAAIDARRATRDPAGRERAVSDALERLDRELIGPLRASAGWLGACLSVTSDLPRTSAGGELRGEVPMVMTGPRHVFIPEPAPAIGPLGTSLPPQHCERGVALMPVVTSPFHLLPRRDPSAPRRFTRDPVSGRTRQAAAALR